MRPAALIVGLWALCSTSAAASVSAGPSDTELSFVLPDDPSEFEHDYDYDYDNASPGPAAAAALQTVTATSHAPHGTGRPLPRRCAFTVEGWRFDLCPVLNVTRDDGTRRRTRWVSKKEDTPPTVTTTVYQLSLGGPLPRNESRPAEELCPDGTWVCMYSECRQ